MHETKLNYNVHVKKKKRNLQIIHLEASFLLQQYRQILNFICIHKYTYVSNNFPLNISLQSYQLAYLLGRQWSQKPCIKLEKVDFHHFSSLLINYTFLKTQRLRNSQQLTFQMLPSINSPSKGSLILLIPDHPSYRLVSLLLAFLLDSSQL